MGRGNKSLCKWSRSHNQDGCFIYGKNLHKFSKFGDIKTGHGPPGTQVYKDLV